MKSIFIWLKDDLRSDLVSIPVIYRHTETDNGVEMELSYGAKDVTQ